MLPGGTAAGVGGAALRRFLLLILFLLAWQSATPVHAHFQTGYSLRVVHAEAEAAGIRVFYRISFGLAVANGLGPRQADGSYVPAPYTWNEAVGSAVIHHLDLARIRESPLGLAQIIVDGHVIAADGNALAGDIRKISVHPKGTVPPFDTIAEARAAVAGPAYPEGGPEVDANSALVDVEAFYPTHGLPRAVTIRSTLHPGRISGSEVINLVSYTSPDGGFTSRQFGGYLVDPVPLFESPLIAALSFANLGVFHILQGSDHVLFVICLILGAAGLNGLLWRVTGFTLGHSVTLACGALGYAPSAPWFIPLIETGIAISIIYAASVVLLGLRSTRMAFAVTALIGLLHGYGFSFVLKDLVGGGTSHLALRLGSFNVGVEIGQLVIVLLVFPTLVVLARQNIARHDSLRRFAATGALWIAGYWVIQRLPGLLAEISI